MGCLPARRNKSAQLLTQRMQPYVAEHSRQRGGAVEGRSSGMAHLATRSIGRALDVEQAVLGSHACDDEVHQGHGGDQGVDHAAGTPLVRASRSTRHWLPVCSGVSKRGPSQAAAAAAAAAAWGTDSWLQLSAWLWQAPGQLIHMLCPWRLHQRARCDVCSLDSSSSSSSAPEHGAQEDGDGLGRHILPVLGGLPGPDAVALAVCAGQAAHQDVQDQGHNADDAQGG